MSSFSTAAKRATLTLGTASAAWIAYDYQTQHPMRQHNNYQLEQAAIRLHNLLVTKRPQLQLQLLPSFVAPRMITLDELAGYNQPPKICFSAGGYVYDVTESELFGQAYGQWKGKDATVALARMSLSADDVNRTDCWNELTAEEQESLDSWTRYFQEKYWIQGRLYEYWNSEE